MLFLKEIFVYLMKCKTERRRRRRKGRRKRSRRKEEKREKELENHSNICGSGDQTQDLTYSSSMFYHWEASWLLFNFISDCTFSVWTWSFWEYIVVEGTVSDSSSLVHFLCGGEVSNFMNFLDFFSLIVELFRTVIKWVTCTPKPVWMWRYLTLMSYHHYNF